MEAVHYLRPLVSVINGAMEAVLVLILYSRQLFIPYNNRLFRVIIYSHRLNLSFAIVPCVSFSELVEQKHSQL